MSNNIESILNEARVFPPNDAFVQHANVSGMAAYQALCAEAEQSYEAYWARLALMTPTLATPGTPIGPQATGFPSGFLEWNFEK